VLAPRSGNSKRIRYTPPPEPPPRTERLPCYTGTIYRGNNTGLKYSVPTIVGYAVMAVVGMVVAVGAGLIILILLYG
jgi:hypothetical protein